jgi:hypothetical protein
MLRRQSKQQQRHWWWPHAGSKALRRETFILTAARLKLIGFINYLCPACCQLKWSSCLSPVRVAKTTNTDFNLHPPNSSREKIHGKDTTSPLRLALIYVLCVKNALAQYTFRNVLVAYSVPEGRADESTYAAFCTSDISYLFLKNPCRLSFKKSSLPWQIDRDLCALR